MKARWMQREQRSAWLAAVALLILVDQVSKSHFATTLELGESIKVTDWLNFVHVLNTGAAFSLLADAGGWQRWFFIGVTALVVGVVSVVCLARQAEPLDRWVGAFVVGGGAGNLVDRVQIGLHLACGRVQADLGQPGHALGDGLQGGLLCRVKLGQTLQRQLSQHPQGRSLSSSFVSFGQTA